MDDPVVLVDDDVDHGDGGLSFAPVSAEERALAARVRSEQFDLLAADASTGTGSEADADPFLALELLTMLPADRLGYDQALSALQAAQRLASFADACRAVLMHALLAAASDDPASAAFVPDPALAASLTVTDIAAALGLPERTAGDLTVRSGELVQDFPATLAALAAGTITWTKAVTITENAHGLPAHANKTYERELLTAAAAGCTRPQLAARARRYREQHHPEALTRRHRAAVEDRRVCFDPAPDGMAWLAAYLPADTALAAYHRLRADAAAAKTEGTAATGAQLEADLFTRLLLHNDSTAGPGQTGSRAGVSPRATVSVTVPLLTLLGADIPADLDGYGPIPAETARRLAAGCPSLYRLLTHPETGAVLSVGRDAYTAPKSLARYLAQRDGTCRFPGCNRAVRSCQLDHTTEWQHGGTTSAGNLAHLCPKHHRFKTIGRWTYRHLNHGTLEWTSPTGRIYLTQPRT
ncbi:HNH endonuclease [Paenarthrobacter sp. DKR-5]|uniref:HNH endonuclease signature motif containing protein n=1 Tax=Paenarthrobacter sp. DKR-5 TaxID=2835535 RepID=UPI001BDCD1FA|nr:HNH endonuclease signature motif containing protein [Paenarthrobacter sp. DKR-5]MBT1003066.1 HNH endonuclease [Paenarthrobacter sp. DKR-5]